MAQENHRILIADDKKEFHQQIRFAFRQHYEFEGAIDIQQLEEKLNENIKYDLILLDLIFNDETQEKIGLEWITKILESRPALPIIVVTNDNDIDTVLEAINRGAKSFLYKKIRPRKMGQQISRNYTKRKINAGKHPA